MTNAMESEEKSGKNTLHYGKENRVLIIAKENGYYVGWIDFRNEEYESIYKSEMIVSSSIRSIVECAAESFM